MGIREWKVSIKQNKTIIDRCTSHKLSGACYKVLEKLHALNALDCYDKGTFIETRNVFKDYNVVKRYVITLICPYTTIIIEKKTKGSINVDEFWSTFKAVKEVYFERI